jgi:uncharacterized protein
MAIDPVILFFVLGVAAGLMRSELRLPAPVYELVSMVLLLSIGLKGGVELARQPALDLMPQIAAVTVMGIVLTLLAFPLLRGLGRFSRVDAAAIAAHYGSVSVGTFAVAAAYLSYRQISFEQHMPLFVVVLEIPAIIVGVMLAKGVARQQAWGSMLHEVLCGKSMVLLVGGLLVGWGAGEDGVQSIKPLFFDLFKGVLALFLLEMGLIAAGHLGGLLRQGLFLLGFGMAMPLIGAVVGTMVALGLGLSLGGTVLLATMAASASYIAAPAAFRLVVPEAKPAFSLAASLGVTFPFNIVLGIPLYHWMAERAQMMKGVW